MNLALVNPTYSPSNFIPKTELLSEDQVDKTIEDIYQLDAEMKLEESAKLCLKLIDRPFSRNSEHTLLHSAINKLILNSIANKKDSTKKDPCIDKFNFSEIWAFESSFEKSDYHHHIQQNSAKQISEYFNSKIQELRKAYNNTINNTLLLCKTQFDNNCSLAQLATINQDVIQTIKLKCLELIADICLTPVDFSRQTGFPPFKMPPLVKSSCATNARANMEARLKAEEIRINAEHLACNGEFIKSAKELLPLFNTKAHTIGDSVLLHKVICRQIEQQEPCADFNLSDFIIIKSSCQEIIDSQSNDGDIDIRASKLFSLLNSLDSITAPLIKSINEITANTLLVLDSKHDEKCMLTQNLPAEIFHKIALHSHAMIDAIFQTPVIIGPTKETFFAQFTSRQF